jgi:hypothetical protein
LPGKPPACLAPGPNPTGVSAPKPHFPPLSLPSQTFSPFLTAPYPAEVTAAALPHADVGLHDKHLCLLDEIRCLCLSSGLHRRPSSLRRPPLHARGRDLARPGLQAPPLHPTSRRAPGCSAAASLAADLAPTLTASLALLSSPCYHGQRFPGQCLHGQRWPAQPRPRATTSTAGACLGGVQLALEVNSPELISLGTRLHFSGT